MNKQRLDEAVKVLRAELGEFVLMGRHVGDDQTRMFCALQGCPIVRHGLSARLMAMHDCGTIDHVVKNAEDYSKCFSEEAADG